MPVSILRLRWPAWCFPSQFRGPSNLQGQVCVSGFSFLPSVSRAERTSCWEVACDLLSFVLSVPSLQGRPLMAWGTRGPEGVPDSGSSRSDAGLAGTCQFLSCGAVARCLPVLNVLCLSVSVSRGGWRLSLYLVACSASRWHI